MIEGWRALQVSGFLVVALLGAGASCWASDEEASDAPVAKVEAARPQPFAAAAISNQSRGVVEREHVITLQRPVKMYLRWEVRQLNSELSPVTRVRLYRQLPSGQWRIAGTLMQMHVGDEGRTPVMQLTAGSYRLEILSKAMAWTLTPMYPDGDPSKPREADKPEAGEPNPDKTDDPLNQDDADDPLLDEGESPHVKADDDKPADAPPVVEKPEADKPADPVPVDTRKWRSLVSAKRSNKTPDRDYHSFTLARPETLRFTWKTEPLGSPQFRVTLAAWNESIEDFTYIGVLVRSNGRVQGSAEKKLPADRYRIEISANRVEYEFSIEQLLPEEKKEPVASEAP